jgi:hypothetical protein
MKMPQTAYEYAFDGLNFIGRAPDRSLLDRNRLKPHDVELIRSSKQCGRRSFSSGLLKGIRIAFIL